MRKPAQTVTPLRAPDERYKVDILLVVAHPDDEGAATAYLARAIDEGKRVAVVYGTRGSSGANEVGAEQAAALGAIREIEARRALSQLGIADVWFLDGKDTASQNVLQSLSNWNHGETLQQLVRLMRLTRPEVVLTFLPGTFIGEDHGDHQASGVLATEAFDMSGDPVAFPEQLAGATKRLEPLLDNLRPWQPKKLYYFADADKEDIFRGLGPAYSVKELSKSNKHAYWRIALDGYLAHETQSRAMAESLKGMSDAALEKLMTTEGYWSDSLRFVRGKSLVGGAATGDVFENVTNEPIRIQTAGSRARTSGPGIGGGTRRAVEFLCGVSSRSRVNTFAASGTARDRAASWDYAGNSIVGSERDFFSARDNVVRGTAERLGARKRRGKILHWRKTDGGGTDRSWFAGDYRWR